ncbi:hypothetical protein [Nonomuraea sp. JJY05]|uniref:hypothetical protein n=1 Tax=Nonomuraea sp. JJY05 TaxID=3350255 RepID=UPI00373F12A7
MVLATLRACAALQAHSPGYCQDTTRALVEVVSGRSETDMDEVRLRLTTEVERLRPKPPGIAKAVKSPAPVRPARVRKPHPAALSQAERERVPPC